MIETGAYGERMAGYLHLIEPPIHVRLGFGRSELAVTRLHAPDGFSDPTSPIPLERVFSIHLHVRANQGGRRSVALWQIGTHRQKTLGSRPGRSVSAGWKTAA
jgi:AraC family transcriptional regulator